MKQQEEILLSNATIWNGVPMRKIQGSMRIRHGRIAGIAEHDGDGPPGGKDLKGTHIIPGLTDASGWV